MKRSAFLIVLFVAGVVFYSASFGSLLGDQNPKPRPTVEVIDAQEADGAIQITVKSHQLYPMTVRSWYSLTDPATGAVFYTAPAVEQAAMPPLGQVTIPVPIPNTIVAGDWHLNTYVSEVIAYVANLGYANFSLSQTLTVAGVTMGLRSASLTPAGDGQYQLAAEVSLADDTGGDFRYALTISHISQQENTLLAQDRVYLSAFTPFSLTPKQVIEAPFSDTVTLPPGQYVVLLWVQKRGDDGFEQYTQYNYPQLFTIGAS